MAGELVVVTAGATRPSGRFGSTTEAQIKLPSNTANARSTPRNSRGAGSSQPPPATANTKRITEMVADSTQKRREAKKRLKEKARQDAAAAERLKQKGKPSKKEKQKKAQKGKSAMKDDEEEDLDDESHPPLVEDFFEQLGPDKEAQVFFLSRVSLSSLFP